MKVIATKQKVSATEQNSQDLSRYLYNTLATAREWLVDSLNGDGEPCDLDIALGYLRDVATVLRFNGQDAHYRRILSAVGQAIGSLVVGDAESADKAIGVALSLLLNN